jgi:hypothetical protein
LSILIGNESVSKVVNGWLAFAAESATKDSCNLHNFLEMLHRFLDLLHGRQCFLLFLGLVLSQALSMMSPARLIHETIYLLVG